MESVGTGIPHYSHSFFHSFGAPIERITLLTAAAAAAACNHELARGSRTTTLAVVLTHLMDTARMLRLETSSFALPRSVRVLSYQ